MNQREEYYRLQNIARAYHVPFNDVEHGYRVLVNEIGYPRENAISSLEATFAQQEHTEMEERRRKKFLRAEHFDMQQDRRCVE